MTHRGPFQPLLFCDSVKTQLRQLSDFSFGQVFLLIFYTGVVYKSLPGHDELQHGEAGALRSRLGELKRRVLPAGLLRGAFSVWAPSCEICKRLGALGSESQEGDDSACLPNTETSAHLQE